MHLLYFKELHLVVKIDLTHIIKLPSVLLKALSANWQTDFVLIHYEVICLKFGAHFILIKKTL